MNNDLKEFLKDNDIPFTNYELYEQAFSHMSFVNENKKDFSTSYERLEFLGDSILSQIVATYIFKNFSELDQGDMTLLRSYVVNKDFLSKAGKNISLEKYINIGKGDREQIISASVIEDVFESLVAAIYLDCGYNEIYKFLYKNILILIHNINLKDLKDYKTKLQEFLQSESDGIIEYKQTNKTKTNSLMNQYEFEVEVIFQGHKLGHGKGNSKKKAEQNAARKAYERMVK